MFSIDRQENNGVCGITVSGEMTIYSAAELKDKLLAAAAGADRVELDLSAITEFDSAGVQLLALLQRAAGEEGEDGEPPAIRIAGASDCVRELLELFRLSGSFGCAGAGAASAHPGSAS